VRETASDETRRRFFINGYDVFGHTVSSRRWQDALSAGAICYLRQARPPFVGGPIPAPFVYHTRREDKFRRARSSNVSVDAVVAVVAVVVVVAVICSRLTAFAPRVQSQSANVRV